MTFPTRWRTMFIELAVLDVSVILEKPPPSLQRRTTESPVVWSRSSLMYVQSIDIENAKLVYAMGPCWIIDAPK